MCTENQLIKIISEIVRAYQEVFGSDIRSILLYGSYARGDYSDQSDIDFAAIVNGDRLELQNKLRIVWDKASDIGVENDAVISPVVIPYQEFERYKGSLPYYRNIEEEGRRVG